MKSVVLFAVAFASQTAPALAEPSTAAKSVDEAVAAIKLDPGKRYCFQDTLTGSRIPTKVCKTRAEWIAEGIDMDKVGR